MTKVLILLAALNHAGPYHNTKTKCLQVAGTLGDLAIFDAEDFNKPGYTVHFDEDLAAIKKWEGKCEK
jgi:hypothetical protein